MHVKKICLLIIILPFCFLFTGCWDYVEYEHMAIVSAIGFDYNKSTSEVTITLQMIKPQKSKEGNTSSPNDVTTNSVTSYSYADSLARLQESIPQKLFYGYAQEIVIGEEAAKFITRDIIDMNVRTPSLRSSVNVIVCKGKAMNILDSIKSSKEIYTTTFTQEKTGYTRVTTLNEFQQMLVTSGSEPVTSKIFSINDQGEEVENANLVHGSAKTIISGVAVFKGNDLVGWLNSRETKGYSYIRGKIRGSYEHIEDPTSKDKDLPLKNSLQFYITKSKCKTKVTLKDGKPQVKLNIYATASLRKYSTAGPSEFLDENVISKLETQLQKAIYEDVNLAVTKCQHDLDSDIFGFGFEFYRQHQKLWHAYYKGHWEKMFSSIPVSINVKVKVINTGTNIKRYITR